jgi:hypothetical protein
MATSKTCITMLICTLFVIPLVAEEPVYIADDVLRAAIEEELGFIDPTPTDMSGLTSLRQSMERETQADGIRSIAGIQYAVNLEDLKLRLNQISSISHLSELVLLEELDLSENEIDSISALSGLHRLSELNLHANSIDSVSALSGLGRLRELEVYANEITDPSPLATLKNLEDLDLHENPISDISSLEQFSQQLRTLDLRHNPMNEEAYSYYLNRITDRNPGLDLSYSASLTSSCVSPVQLLASNGLFSERVCVSWSKVDNGPDYTSRFQLYRALADQPATEVPLGDWQTAHSVEDITAEPGIHYDYRVDILTERIGKSNFYHLHHSDTNTGWAGKSDSIAPAVTLYVDDNAPGDPGPDDAQFSDPHEDGTKAHPFDSIQEAIDRADYDTTVIVRPGTYYECLTLRGKNIHLTGIDPQANKTAPYPTIDPAHTGTALTFNKGEDHRCIVSGFVITRGSGNPASAIACLGSSPTIRNCEIVGNRYRGTRTSAIVCFDSECTLDHCTISDNSNGELGAGLQVVNSNVTLTNSIIRNNDPSQILVDSGNSPIISDCTIEGD